MIKSCHISRISMHVLFFLFFDTNNIQGGIQCDCSFPRRQVIPRTSEKLQGTILFKGKSDGHSMKFFCKVSVMSYHMARAFAKPLISSALQILTSLTHISGVSRTILISKVLASKLKVNKWSYELKKFQYSICLVIFLTNRE